MSLMSGDHATAHESGMATGTCTEFCNNSVVQRESLKRLPQPHEQAKRIVELLLTRGCIRCVVKLIRVAGAQWQGGRGKDV